MITISDFKKFLEIGKQITSKNKLFEEKMRFSVQSNELSSTELKELEDCNLVGDSDEELFFFSKKNNNILVLKLAEIMCIEIYIDEKCKNNQVDCSHSILLTGAGRIYVEILDCKIKSEESLFKNKIFEEPSKYLDDFKNCVSPIVIQAFSPVKDILNSVIEGNFKKKSLEKTDDYGIMYKEFEQSKYGDLLNLLKKNPQCNKDNTCSEDSFHKYEKAECQSDDSKDGVKPVKLSLLEELEMFQNSLRLNKTVRITLLNGDTFVLSYLFGSKISLSSDSIYKVDDCLLYGKDGRISILKVLISKESIKNIQIS